MASCCRFAIDINFRVAVLSAVISVLYSCAYFYRPHPKDWGVCVCVCVCVSQSSLGRGVVVVVGGGGGTQSSLGWGGGTPTLDRGGVPHLRVPPPPGIASTCYGYAAGGVPLAFTQEDFLVVKTLTR